MHARINETSTSWLGFTYTLPRVNPVIELSIEEQCENESTGLIKLEIEIRGKKLGGRSHLDN